MFFNIHLILILFTFALRGRAEINEESTFTSQPDVEPTTRKNTVILEAPNPFGTLPNITVPFGSTATLASSTSEKPTTETSEIPTSSTSKRPTSVTSERPTTETSEIPTSSSSKRPTNITSERPTSSTSKRPTSVTSERPTTSTSERPISSSSESPASSTPDENPIVDELTTLEETNPLIVEISAGKIEGRKVTTKDQNKPYYAFRGIPYGKPPVGDLRFREPLPAEKWDGTFQALEDGPKCVQYMWISGSEDCLYLNVFSPKLRNPIIKNETESNAGESSLPVMVWIYDGVFASTQGKIENFGPDFLIEEDVIVVSVNYRVGVFGFLSTEDYIATGNWGLKDQILALRWVQENIEKFGGNPNNVTLFGESAGAAYVSILVQSPLARGLFHKAIMQSGTSLNPWAHAYNPRKSAFEIGRLLDIRTDNSEILIEQLRKMDWRTLHIVSVSSDLRETVLHNPLDGLVFAPTTEVNHPGAVLTNKSHDILKNGDFNRIPLLVGYNSQESLPFVNVLTYLRPYIASYDLFSTRLVPRSLNLDSNILKVVVARLIKMKYFGLSPILFAGDKLTQFVTDDQFARPIYEYVRQTSKYTPTYFYIFSYEGPLGIDGKKRESPGVGHAENNKYLWYEETNINNAPDEDIKTRKRLVRLWTNFAKAGNPTPAADPLLQDVTWSPANIRAMVYLNISSDLRLETAISRYNIHFWDLIFQYYGRPPYDTY